MTKPQMICKEGHPDCLCGHKKPHTKLPSCDEQKCGDGPKACIPVEPEPTCPEKVCKFCGKPDIDWDEDCDGEGFHEAADLKPAEPTLKEQMLGDKEFMAGIKRGLQDVKDGKVRAWSEIKEELRIEPAEPSKHCTSKTTDIDTCQKAVMEGCLMCKYWGIEPAPQMPLIKSPYSNHTIWDVAVETQRDADMAWHNEKVQQAWKEFAEILIKDIDKGRVSTHERKQIIAHIRNMAREEK